MISVVLPNYNYARFLKARIEGILSQTCQDFELIILDDASTDDGRDIIEQYRGHPKVTHIVYNDKNSGSVFRQWNKGVALAKGDYVWIAEADDEAEPELLERLVAALEANSQVGLAYCQSNRIDENGLARGTLEEWTADIEASRWKRDFTAAGAAECATALVIKNTIPNASAVVFRRDVFERAGGAVENLRLCGDWMTWINMLLISDIAFIAARLNHFRTHENSVRSASKLSQLCQEEYAVKSYVVRNVQVAPAVRQRAAADSLQKWHWCLGDATGNCNWTWQINIASHVVYLGHPRVSAMLAIYARHRLSLGPVGQFYRFVKQTIKG